MAALSYKPRVERAGTLAAQGQVGAVVWALHEGALVPIRVTLGEDYGARVAIKSDALQLGDLVVIGDKSSIPTTRASQLNGAW